MGEVSTIGLDIAKSVFQVHGVDAGGTVVIRKRVGRAKVIEFFGDLPPRVVGLEACATASPEQQAALSTHRARDLLAAYAADQHDARSTG